MKNRLHIVINENSSSIHYNDLFMRYDNQLTEGLGLIYLNALLTEPDIDRLNNLKVIEIVSYKNLPDNSYFTFKPKAFFNFEGLAVFLFDFLIFKSNHHEQTNH